MQSISKVEGPCMQGQMYINFLIRQAKGEEKNFYTALRRKA